MTRVALVGSAGGSGLGAALAERLGVAHLHRPAQIIANEFVLDGSPDDLVAARALDELLRRRGADLDAVIWIHDATTEQQLTELLEHYRGRIVELDSVAPGDELLDAALYGLGEALLAS